ncbi:MAG TPA: HAD hydrolase-like protein [Gemmatales bacterium]|nr:HAD hydrolase-like protein [Gemmatales bacterium]
MSAPYLFLFDIDGTLLSSSGAGKFALESALLDTFNLENIRVQVPYSGRTDAAIARDLLHAHDIEPTQERITSLQEAYLQRLPQALESRQGAVLPGVTPLLNQLISMQQEVLMGLLTGNIRRGAEVKLGHFQLYHYFRFGGFGDNLLTRDEVAHSAWRAAQKEYPGELVPDRTWVVGDTPLDISCARAIGARVLAVATGHHSREELTHHRADLVLDSLEDPSLLGRLLA